MKKEKLKKLIKMVIDDFGVNLSHEQCDYLSEIILKKTQEDNEAAIKKIIKNYRNTFKAAMDHAKFYYKITVCGDHPPVYFKSAIKLKTKADMKKRIQEIYYLKEFVSKHSDYKIHEISLKTYEKEIQAIHDLFYNFDATLLQLKCFYGEEIVKKINLLIDIGKYKDVSTVFLSLI